MRKLLLLLLLSAPCWGTIAFVQSRSTDCGSVTSCNLAFNSSTAAGNLTMVAVRVGANGRTITVTDAQSNSYTQIGSTINDGQGNDAALYYAKNIVGGTTDQITVAISGAAATIRFAIHEYSGLDTLAPLDQNTGQTTGSTTTPTSGNVTTTSASELLFGYYECGSSSTATTCTAGTGYTKREQLVASQLKLCTEEQVVSSTGTYATGVTINASESGVMFIATLKAAAGTAPRKCTLALMGAGPC